MNHLSRCARHWSSPEILHGFFVFKVDIIDLLDLKLKEVLVVLQSFIKYLTHSHFSPAAKGGGTVPLAIGLRGGWRIEWHHFLSLGKYVACCV